ncbi:MAG: CBS domain-containing protein [Deltaproteobacteria bacterium]|nr:CBS domain-containing protein [Deltaproteobacteria bacterium]MBW2600500.1 CBS domain-containing protein [Deltaproteobacteria bacterium]
MLIQGWMTTDVITVTEDMSMMKASILMKEKRIRSLPVVDEKGKLIGIVTDTDLRDASPSKATTLDVYELNYLLSSMKIKDLMTKEPAYVKPDETVEFAAILMVENKISSLPVINNKNALIGIITQTDIFKVLLNITGVYTGGIQFAFSLEDRAGSIKEPADVIRSYGGRIVSILSTAAAETAEEGRRNVYIRCGTIAEDKLRGLVKELEDKFLVLYSSRESMEEIEKRRVRIP